MPFANSNLQTVGYVVASSHQIGLWPGGGGKSWWPLGDAVRGTAVETLWSSAERQWLQGDYRHVLHASRDLELVVEYSNLCDARNLPGRTGLIAKVVAEQRSR